MTKNRSQYRDIIFCILIVAGVFGLFGKVSNYDFITYDDGVYILENGNIQSGLTKEMLLWALTTFYASNWHPLTWVSHSLDIQFCGLNPGCHHMINVLFHTLNSLLLYLFLRKMTNKPAHSFFVACLFAFHPSHVESVAWIAERKDVLSTFFLMALFYTYAYYVKKPSISKYIGMLFLFTCGIMSKPMVVTAPFILLLLDFWPLNRISSDNTKKMFVHILHLSKEKIPFFLLSCLAGVLTFWAQSNWGAVVTLEKIPLYVRLSNSIVSYIRYIGKLFYPRNLAVFYPFPQSVETEIVLPALCCLIALTILSVISFRRFPFLIVGWFWFVGTLVPVIGLVQVGSQSMADRYTYLPYIGLFIIIAWSVSHLAEKFNFPRLLVSLSGIIVIALCMWTTWNQLTFWQNSETLFSHAIDITSDNTVAHDNLGSIAFKKEDYHKAEWHFRESLRINPRNINAINNLGGCLYKQQRYSESLLLFLKSYSLNPRSGIAYNIANCYLKLGQFEKAVEYFEIAIEKEPTLVDAHKMLGIVLFQRGDYQAAVDHFSFFILHKPENSMILQKMGSAYEHLQEFEKARQFYQKARIVDPDDPVILKHLGTLSMRTNQFEQAQSFFEEVLAINPRDAQTLTNLGSALLAQKQLPSAQQKFEEALVIQPDLVEAVFNLGLIAVEEGDEKGALFFMSRAQQLRPDSTRINKIIEDLKNRNLNP